MTRRSGFLAREGLCAKVRRGSHQSARHAASTRRASRRPNAVEGSQRSVSIAKTAKNARIAETQITDRNFGNLGTFGNSLVLNNFASFDLPRFVRKLERTIDARQDVAALRVVR